MKQSYYDDSPQVKKLVEIGRNMISLCEENKLFPKDDYMWNQAVVCGNKLTTIGPPWTRIKTIDDLTLDERKAMLHYLENHSQKT